MSTKVLKFICLIICLFIIQPVYGERNIICFHSNQAGERGVEVAMYDYADFRYDCNMCILADLVLSYIDHNHQLSFCSCDICV